MFVKGSEKMKTAMLVTGSGPLLVSTTCESLAEAGFTQAMHSKGIDKFIACEVSLDRCRHLYPRHFHEQSGGACDDRHVDVLDTDGRRIFLNFPFIESGAPLLVDRQALTIEVTP
jgi:hypothetical protein